MTRPGVPMTICAPCLQAVKLAVVGLAAVNRQRMNAALEERQLMDFLGNLHGQFARGAKDEDLHGALPRIDFFDGGNGEGGRFAGARLRLADDVAALHEERDGFGLDGRGLFEAEFIDGLQQFCGKAKSENNFGVMN